MKINHSWEGVHYACSKEESKAVAEDTAEMIANGVKPGMDEEGTAKNTMKDKVDGTMEGRRDWTGAGKGNEGGTVQG